MALLDLATLIVRLKTDSTQYKQGMTQATTQTQQFGAGVAKFVGGVAVGALVAAGAAAVKFADESLAQFKKFETGMREIFTVIPGISQEAMGALEDDVLQASAAMGRLPEETIPAIYEALSSGVPPDNVFDFIEVANAAALGGVTTLETAVNGITSVVNAYGADVISAGEASDQMFQAVMGGKTTFDQLANSLYNVIPTAAGLGVEFGNVTAALATMTAIGVPTSVATTQLRQLLVELSQAGGDAAETFERMAGQSFVDFIAGGGNVQQALQLMEQAAADGGVRLSDLFSSVEAGNAALSLTGASTEKFTTELEHAAEAAGSTEAAADQFSGSLERSEDMAAAAKAEYQTLVGKGLAPLKQAFYDLKTEIYSNLSASHREEVAVRESTVAHGNAIDVLREAAVATQSLSTRRSELIDVEEGVSEAIEEITRLYPNLNNNTEEAALQTQALEAATLLLQNGFEGTGAELAAAAQEYINTTLAQMEMRDAMISASEAYDGWTASVAASAAAMAEMGVASVEATTMTGLLASGERELTISTQASITAGQLAVEQRAAEAEATRLANESLTAYQVTMGGYFMDALTSATAQEVNWTNELLISANQYGLNTTQLTLLAAATGEYTEEEIRAAVEAMAMREKIDLLAQAIANEEITVANALIELDAFKAELGNTATASDTLATSADNTTTQLEEMAGGYVVTIDANTGQIDSRLSSLEARLAGLGSGGTSGTASGGYQSAPGNAAGTDYWGGGLTWVGEEGPELVDLPAGSTIYSNEESASFGGNTYQITVDARGSTLTERQIEAVITRALDRVAREADYTKRTRG